MTEREGEKLSSMKNEKNDVQRKFVLSWKKKKKKQNIKCYTRDWIRK